MAGWDASTEPLPYARVAGHIQSVEGPADLEVVFQASETGAPAPDGVQAPTAPGPSTMAHVPLQKSYRINGVRRRAVDMMGRLKVVFFGPEDVDLVSGAPALRRRYLDLAASQADRRYLRALQQYNRVITQRNSLLKRIREREADPNQLPFWDEHLVRTGSTLLSYRLRMLDDLEATVRRTHAWLADDDSPVTLDYQGTVEGEGLETADIARAFRKALEARQQREVLAGQTLVGPHRDDVRFLLRDVDMGVYGSRGQRRTLALALKLAEVEYMRKQAGDAPVLLLDDVLSELDARRRAKLLEAVSRHEQTIVTATDLEHFPSGLLKTASVFRVTRGRLEPLGADRLS
jgi:DNA replication and repair protein RecF